MQDRLAQLSEQHIAVQQLLEEWQSFIHPVEQPEELLQAQAEYDAAEQQHSRENNPERKRLLRKEVRRRDDHLEEVEKRHEAAKADLIWEQLRRFIFQLLNRCGPSAGHQLCKEWCEQAPQAALNIPGPDNDQPDCQSTNSQLASAGERPRAPNIQEAEAQTPGTEAIPTPSRSHSPSERRSVPNRDQPQVESTGPRTRSKRRTNSFIPRVPRPPKRSRSSYQEGRSLAKETVEFDEIYHDGKAMTKYTIAKRYNYYYILRCNEHNLHFHENPLHRAMWHLRKGHGYGGGMTFEKTLNILGVRVLNCDEKKSKMNNEVSKSYYKEMEDQLGWPNTLEGIDPQPGEIYTAVWEVEAKQKQKRKQKRKRIQTLYACLVLPQRVDDELNIDDLAVMTLDLGRIPDCYEFNETDGTYDWARGYGPGEEKFSERKYPVMCFDSAGLPGTVSWLSIGHFRPFYAQSRNQASGTRNVVEEDTEQEENDQGTEDQDEAGLNDYDPTRRYYAVRSTDTGAELIVIDDDDNETPMAHYQPPGPPPVMVKSEPESEDEQVHTSDDTLPSNFGVTSSSLEPTVERLDNAFYPAPASNMLIGVFRTFARMHQSPDRVASAPEAIMAEFSASSGEKHQSLPVGNLSDMPQPAKNVNCEEEQTDVLLDIRSRRNGATMRLWSGLIQECRIETHRSTMTTGTSASGQNPPRRVFGVRRSTR
ncbi:hypothetical protein F53441_9602 [Fusarium austroafricanum]|uniref:Uncharacterized protein n=1 Tax=Fusarium austroafricanum TaxID=2364996 RepID=A0A8H4KBD5_9HYPO|nr:hypothetical protein F53441_9602 [Fusarium austroafricanum]